MPLSPARSGHFAFQARGARLLLHIRPAAAGLPALPALGLPLHRADDRPAAAVQLLREIVVQAVAQAVLAA